MSKHNPTPWAVFQKGGAIGDATGAGIAALWRDGEEQKANADFIVRACNAHDELVELVKCIIENGTCYPSAIEMTGPVGVDFEEWGARAIAMLSKLEGK